MNSSLQRTAIATGLSGLLAGTGFNAAAQPVAVSTEVLGPFTGAQAKLHPDNLAPHRIEYDGTDLGFSYEHRGKLQFLFGDTTAKPSGEPIQASTNHRYDDAFGFVDLARWNDPTGFSKGHLPLILIGQNPASSEAAAIDPGHVMELFKTPVAGFSNGEREFGIFFTYKPKACATDADCSNGSRCDTGLGYMGPPPDQDEGLTFSCVDGSSPACVAATLKGVEISGLCSDRTSSVWSDKPFGRTGAVTVTQLIATRNESTPKLYHTDHTWQTSKFMNPSVRTVRNFSPPASGRDFQPDYRPATAAASGARLFIWGRPHFLGVNKAGRTLSQYFAYLDLPGRAGYAWQPNYFAGLDARGFPQFSRNESDARPLDMDSSRPGVQPDDEFDIVNQVSIAWVPVLSKWVMFFGGGILNLPIQPAYPRCGLLELFTGPDCTQVSIGNGAFRMRTADNPWGPWSPAQELIAPGDPAVARGEYGPGGMLRHPDCRDPRCAPFDNAEGRNPREYGFFYAANIIEQWIRPAGDGVDVIWNASTWAPYRVILLRTHLRR